MRPPHCVCTSHMPVSSDKSKPAACYSTMWNYLWMAPISVLSDFFQTQLRFAITGGKWSATLINLVYFVMSIHWDNYCSFNLAQFLTTENIFMNNICAGCWERHFLEGAGQKGMCMKNLGFHQWARLSLCAYMGQTLVVGCWTISIICWRTKSKAKEIFKSTSSSKSCHIGTYCIYLQVQGRFLKCSKFFNSDITQTYIEANIKAHII